MNRRLFIKISSTLASSLLFTRCKKLTEIEDISTSIPYYYYENNYLSNKISRINYLMQQDGTIDAFIFITDQHWGFNAKNSPCLMSYIQKGTGIKRCFSGGDVADVYSQNSYDYMNALKNAWQGDIHCVVGNHEFLGKDATNDKVAKLFETNPSIQYGNRAAHYYYVDNYSNKIRYIILASYSQSVDGGSHAKYGFGYEQAIWLKNVALDVEEGWSILLFTHFLYYIGILDDKIQLFDDENNIEQIIDEYDGNGKIIGMFHGHNHRDRVIRMAKSNIPVIVTTCDKYKILDNDQQNIYREKGTILEQAFDVVIINKFTRNINCVRIGCPAKNGIGDNVGYDVEERVIGF